MLGLGVALDECYCNVGAVPHIYPTLRRHDELGVGGTRVRVRVRVGHDGLGLGVLMITLYCSETNNHIML